MAIKAILLRDDRPQDLPILRAVDALVAESAGTKVATDVVRELLVEALRRRGRWPA